MASASNSPVSGIVNDYLLEIAKQVAGRRCVFRGQENADWPLQSGAERRIRRAISKGLPEGSPAPDQFNTMRSMLAYHEELLKKARRRGFGIMDGRVQTELEVLAKLQHFGADTALLDFTEKAAVALYFACQEATEKRGKKKEMDGRVYIVPYSNITTVSHLEEDNLTSLIEKEDLRIWFPTIHGDAERRILAQSGLFLINMNEDGHDLLSITIDHNDKVSILQGLRDIHQISANTLFMDLSGFAQNELHESELEEAWVYYYRSTAKEDIGLREEALEELNKAIELKPDFATAYVYRGYIQNYLGNHDEALEDLDEAIKQDPDRPVAYNNRGYAKHHLNKYVEAIIDFDESIRINPEYHVALVNRGLSKARLNLHDEAVQDYSKANQIDPNNWLAVFNRGISKLHLCDYDGAFQDLHSAATLDAERFKGELIGEEFAMVEPEHRDHFELELKQKLEVADSDQKSTILHILSTLNNIPR